MPHDYQPGQTYWALIKPYWLPLNESWDFEAEPLLARFRDVPSKVGHLYAAHWCQSEVCNGGLHQFFFNTTGILAPEALNGFRAIGLHEWSAILAEAMRYFGVSYPRDRLLRFQQLPESNGRPRETWDPFIPLDNRFYAWQDAENDRWELAADKYALSD